MDPFFWENRGRHRSGGDLRMAFEIKGIHEIVNISSLFARIQSGAVV